MLTYEFLQLCKRYNGGEGKYKAKCPCGCSRAYTLNVTAKDGITLIYCQSGCKAKDIVDTLGITFDDLRDERNMSWATEAIVCR